MSIVECPFHDTYPDPDSPTGQTDIDLEPGIHHLDGKFALWYVRSRWSTSDFDRHRASRRYCGPSSAGTAADLFGKVPEFWDIYRDSVETDIGLTNALYFASLASRFDMHNLKSRFIRGSSLVQSWTAPTAATSSSPGRRRCTIFSWRQRNRRQQPRLADQYRVEVWNGTGHGMGPRWPRAVRSKTSTSVAVRDVEFQPRTQIGDLHDDGQGIALPR